MQDQRQYTRRLLRTVVRIVLSEDRIYEAKSFDISIGGMSLLVPGKNLAIGQLCTLRFELVFHGKIQKINATGKVVYSICAGSGFKVGVQFTKMEGTNGTVIEAFINMK